MENYVPGLIGTDEEGFVVVHATGIEPEEQPAGTSPTKALEGLRAEQANGGAVQDSFHYPLLQPPEFMVPNATIYRLQSQDCDGALKYPDGNPKTAMGAKKPDLSVVPPTALLHLATAMMNGSEKYGPFNYRDDPVSARTYIAAAFRHLMAYLDGEEFSADTEETGAPVHHLAHVMACCAILLDTMEVGTLLDNRPKVKGRSGQMIETYAKTKRFTQRAEEA